VSVEYTCNAGWNTRPPTKTSGNNPVTTCQVCHLDVGPDMDSTPGQYVGNISFGQNMIGGAADESLVTGYALRLVYANGLPALNSDLSLMNTGGQGLGTSISKATNPSWASSCCLHDKYEVMINISVPSDPVHIMVLPLGANSVRASFGKMASLVDAFPTPAPTPTPPTPPPTPVITPTPSPVTVVATQVSGNVNMQVPNAAAFVNDPVAKEGVRDGLATTTGVPKQYITVNMRVGRRLSAERFLQSSSVIVDYIILIPAAATNVPPTVSGSSIATSLTTVAPTVFASRVTQSITQANGPTYSVTVNPIQAPTVQTITAPPVLPTLAPRGSTSAAVPAARPPTKAVLAALLAAGATAFRCT